MRGVGGGPIDALAELANASFEYPEIVDLRQRRHSSLGYSYS